MSSGQELWKRNYYRDDRDRIVALQRGSNNGANPMENGRGDHFWYDAEGQLTDGYYGALDPVNNPQGQLRQDHFEYDPLGNRRRNPSNLLDNLLASRGWMQFTREDNKLNQYHSWGSNPATYDEDVPGWGSPQHANGVLMQEGHVTAGYNSLNQMVMVAGTPDWIFFGYDPLGRRVKQWTGGLAGNNLVPEPGDSTATYFYYDGWNLIQEGPSAAVASRNYIHGARVDEIVKQITPGNWWERYFHYDARGHCSLQTDAGGNIVEQYDYDAFGQPYFYDWAGNALVQYNSATGQWEGYSPWGNRFLFTGREWLSDNGTSPPHNLKLYDYRSRMYQPEIGRFMQPDPKQFEAGDYNLYRYCHNDPVNKSDPTGLEDSGKRMSEDEKVRLREITFKVPLGSNIKQWVPTGRVLDIAKGLFSRLMDAMKKDHIDRTQTVYKDGKFSGVAQKTLLANNSTGVFVRDRGQELVPYAAGHGGVAIFLHVHSVWSGSTAFPNPDEDWKAVKSWQRPMLFSSEPLYQRQIGFLITPNGRRDPTETAVDLRP
jgi:RHS repeat-associated protein